MKFYHSKTSRIILSFFWGFCFFFSLIIYALFINDLINELDSLKKVGIFLLNSVIPTLFILILGSLFKTTVRNKNPICIIKQDKIIHTEFNGRGTTVNELFMIDVRNVTQRKGIFGETMILIKTRGDQNYPIGYINMFLSKRDKIKVIEEMNKNLSTANKGYN